jgi:translation initiation factor 5
MGKVEGRGNGIKTAIPNMTQLAFSLHRDPAEVTKFFGTELGAQTTWDKDTERSIVNGAHTTQDLQTNLFKYIEKFVLCPNCRLPETGTDLLYFVRRVLQRTSGLKRPEYKMKKDDTIFSKCAACGASEMLDMTHKLTTFILAQDKKLKKDKKDKEKELEKLEGKKEAKKGKTVTLLPLALCYLLTRIAQGW